MLTMCEKQRILTAPNRHQPLRRVPSSSLHSAPWHPFTPPAPIARHDIFKATWLRRKQQSTAIRASSFYLPPENDFPRTSRKKTLQIATLPTKQRALRSQKQAGAETTCRTAWIEYQIFLDFVCITLRLEEAASWLFIRQKLL